MSDLADICPVGTTAPHSLAEHVLEEALTALIETCSRQLGIFFIPTNDVPQDDAPRHYSSHIELSTGKGRWILSVQGGHNSVASLARAMFASEEGVEISAEDMADALNELVNVAAGVLKSYRQHAGQAVSIGLPSFRELVREEAASGASPYQSRFLVNPDGCVFQVVVRWQEGALNEHDAA